jgi:hypothetical protein
MKDAAPLSLEDARTLGMLEGLSPEGEAYLRRILGEPVGPDGIPQTTCTMASLRAVGSSGDVGDHPLAAVLLLLVFLASTLTLTGLDKWLYLLWRPLRSWHRTRKIGLPWAEILQIDRLVVALTYDSPFLKFYRRQCLASGILQLVITVTTCCIGAIILLVPSWLRGISVLDAARRGEWEPALFVGDFIMRRTRPLHSYQRAAGGTAPALAEELEVEAAVREEATPPPSR